MDAFHSDDSTENTQNLENINGSVASFLNCTVLGVAYDIDKENNYESEVFSELDDILNSDCGSYESYKNNFYQIKEELNKEKAEEINQIYREHNNRGDAL